MPGSCTINQIEEICASLKRDCDSDHFMVETKLRQRISIVAIFKENGIGHR